MLDEALLQKVIAYALQVINESRKEKDLVPLELDSSLSRFSQEHASDMLGNNYISHYDQRGDKPYHRLFRAGCHEHIMENLYGQDGEQGALDEPTMFKLIEDIHHCFISEEAPNDPDYQNIYSRHHTHVGIGLAVEDSGVRYVELYSARYATLSESMPLLVLPSGGAMQDDGEGGEQDLAAEVCVVVQGTVFQPEEMAPFGVVVYREGHPGNLNIEELQSSFNDPAYLDGGEDVVATCYPWDISFEPSTGVFSAPLHIPVPSMDHTYYCVLYTKADPSSIPYNGPEDGVEVANNPEVVPACTWVLNLPGYASSSALSSTLRELRMGEEDIFSQSSSRNVEEELAKTYARSTLEGEDRQPLSMLCVAVGQGSLAPSDGYDANVFMPLERHERITAHNLNVWFRRAEGEEAEDEDALVIDEVMILAGHEEELLPPDGFERLLTDLAEPPAGGRMDSPGTAESGEEDEEDDAQFHAYIYIKRAPRSECVAPISDLVLVYGSSTFAMGHAFETLPFPQSLSTLFQAHMYLGIKRKGAARAWLASQGGQQGAGLPTVQEGGGEAEGQGQEEEEEGAQGEEQGRGGEEGSTEHGGEGSTLAGVTVGEESVSLLHPSLGPEELMDLERHRAQEGARRAMMAEQEEEAQRKQEALEDLRVTLLDRQEERERLIKEQVDLQRRLAAVLATQKLREASTAGAGGGNNGNNNGAQQEPAREKDVASVAESERQYSDTLHVIMDLKAKMRRQKDETEMIAGELQYRLDEKHSKAEDISASFIAFKREIALTSENSRTGKPIPDKVIDQFESMEARKDEELERVRLKNITLRMHLRKLEKSLRAKEQLAEGLHLIDFEQLKIENQTLSEKIEERNEELQKLRKKATITVQVLTHVKEKLQFVGSENTSVRQRLSRLDSELTGERERLRRAKKERDRLRGDNVHLKQNQGFAASDLLVVDYEKRRVLVAGLRTELSGLKEHFHQLSNQSKGLASAPSGEFQE